MPVAAKRIRILAGMLDKATKFLLPNCAELVDSSSLNDAHLELLRLPYPVTVFEASWIKDDHQPFVLNGEVESLSSRRIALCWELTDDFAPFEGLNDTVRRAFPDGGVFVYPISYGDEAKVWSPGLGGQFIPCDYKVSKDFRNLPASELVQGALRDAGRLHKSGFRFRAEPFVLLDEPFDQLVAHKGSDIPTGLAHVIHDSNDEVVMAVQACAVLNCANVSTVDASPSKAMNAKRAATNRPPFFTYKVLQLAADKRHEAEANGSHAGPRTHLRRGHIRRLESRVTWVRATLVNPGSERGQVTKDYRLDRSTQSD